MVFPWPPPARSSRFYRLVGVLLAGSALLATAATLRAQDANAKQDQAVVEITKLGGKVERDEKAPDKPVINVNLALSQVTDESLAAVEGLAKLQRLSLVGTKITDKGLEHLKGLTELKKLYLVDTKVTDAGLEHLKGLSNLQILSLVGTQVTDAGLDHLKGLSNLQTLFLYGTKVTDAGVKKLQEALPKAKVER